MAGIIAAQTAPDRRPGVEMCPSKRTPNSRSSGPVKSPVRPRRDILEGLRLLYLETAPNLAGVRSNRGMYSPGPSNPFSLYGDYPLKSAEGRFRLVPIRNPAETALRGLRTRRPTYASARAGQVRRVLQLNY